MPAFGGLDFRCFLICVPSVTLFLNQPPPFKDKKESQIAARREKNIGLNLRLWLTGVVPEGHSVPRDVRHALLAEGVLIRE